MTTFSPVSCFSYLASVHTLNVERYPEINYGVEVLDSDQFLAGDGPLVAGFLRALGHQATLGSNQVGDDTSGRDILTRLRRWDVTLAPSTMSVTRTRTNVVVCDRDGNRTWFSGLRGIVPELADIDVRALASAPTVYIDCYEVLETAPRALLTAALDAGAEIVLNLGGSPPPRWLAAAAGGRRVSVAQTNGDENDPAKAQRTLNTLTELCIADIAVVTTGRQGAIARPGDGQVIATPAVPVDVRQVQGAGSAFSAALIHARSRGQELPGCLRYACAAGSLWCSRTPDGPLPSAADITAAMHAG
jgi:sugar/nucleoside kinase (ribokinase family)